MKGKFKAAHGLCLLLGLAGCASRSPHSAQMDNLMTPVGFHEKWSASNCANRDNKAIAIDNVISGNAVYSADAFGRVQARHLADGRLLWESQLPQSLSSGPSVSENYVIVSSREGMLYALDTQRGKAAWATQLPTETLAKAFIDEKEQRLVVHGTDASVYALDLQTGQRLWTHDHDAPALVLRATSPVIGFDDLLIVGQPTGKVQALYASTGDTAWESVVAIPTGHSEIQRMVDIVAAPVVDEGRLFVVSYQGKLAAISPSSGRLIWDKPLSSVSNFVVAESVVYITDTDNGLWAINASSGETFWHQTALSEHPLTGPAFWDNQLWVADASGDVFSLDKASGKLKGRYDASRQAMLQPKVDDVMLVSGEDGRLIIISTK